jgi:hypothetical protein
LPSSAAQRGKGRGLLPPSHNKCNSSTQHANQYEVWNDQTTPCLLWEWSRC